MCIMFGYYMIVKRHTCLPLYTVHSTGLNLIGQLGSGDSGSSSESEDSSSDSSDDSMGLAR